MNKLPPGSGACCLPNVNGITYIKIGPHGDSIGMMGLDTIFQQLFVLGRPPEEVSETELVGMARKFNWIADKTSVEAEYGIALSQAYSAFYASQKKKA